MTTTYQIRETKQDISNRLAIVNTMLSVTRKVQSLTSIEDEECLNEVDDLLMKKAILENKLKYMN